MAKLEVGKIYGCLKITGKILQKRKNKNEDKNNKKFYYATKYYCECLKCKKEYCYVSTLIKKKSQFCCLDCEKQFGNNKVPNNKQVLKINDVFGELIVIEGPFYIYNEKRKHRMQACKVRCHCNKIFTTKCHNLIHNKIKSCGCSRFYCGRKGTLAENGEKKCSCCGIFKAVENFYPDKQSRDGFRTDCKKCGFGRHIKRRFGITIEIYDELLEKQNYCCKICQKTLDGDYKENFSIDHCHITGKIRGLLCGKCNTAIGMLGDSIPMLESAINYLKISQTDLEHSYYIKSN